MLKLSVALLLVALAINASAKPRHYKAPSFRRTYLLSNALETNDVNDPVVIDTHEPQQNDDEKTNEIVDELTGIDTVAKEPTDEDNEIDIDDDSDDSDSSKSREKPEESEKEKESDESKTQEEPQTSGSDEGTDEKVNEEESDDSENEEEPQTSGNAEESKESDSGEEPAVTESESESEESESEEEEKVVKEDSSEEYDEEESSEEESEETTEKPDESESDESNYPDDAEIKRLQEELLKYVFTSLKKDLLNSADDKHRAKYEEIFNTYIEPDFTNGHQTEKVYQQILKDIKAYHKSLGEKTSSEELDASNEV